MSRKSVKYLGSVLTTAAFVVNPLAANAGGMSQVPGVNRSMPAPGVNCRPGSNIQSSKFGTRSSSSGQYLPTSVFRCGTSPPVQPGLWPKMARKSAWLGLTELETPGYLVRQSRWSSY